MTARAVSIRKIIISGAIAAFVGIIALVFYNFLAPEPLAPSGAGNPVDFDLLDPAYTNARLGFTLNPPKGWTIDESGQLGTFAVFVPKNPDENNILTSLTVIVEPAEFLEDYVRETRIRLPEILEDFTPLENRRVSLGASEGHLIGGSFVFNGLPVRTLRLITTKNNRGYDITATALTSAWAGQRAAIEAALLTFRP